MTTRIVYQTEARAAGGGRDGISGTTDGHFAVKLTVPREMGGPGGEGVNPEQLFAIGYAACFLGALRYTASLEGKKIAPEADVTASVGIGPREDGGFGLSVALPSAYQRWRARRPRSSSPRRIISAPIPMPRVAAWMSN